MTPHDGGHATPRFMLGCALIGAASLTAAAMPATLESGRQAGLVVVTHGGVGVVVLVPIRARVAMLDYQARVLSIC